MTSIVEKEVKEKTPGKKKKKRRKYTGYCFKLI